MNNGLSAKWAAIATAAIVVLVLGVWLASSGCGSPAEAGQVLGADVDYPDYAGTYVPAQTTQDNRLGALENNTTAQATENATFLKLDGSRPMTNDLNMGTNAITNVGNVDGVDVSARIATLDNYTTGLPYNHVKRYGAVSGDYSDDLPAFIACRNIWGVVDVSGSYTFDLFGCYTGQAEGDGRARNGKLPTKIISHVPSGPAICSTATGATGYILHGFLLTNRWQTAFGNWSSGTADTGIFVRNCFGIDIYDTFVDRFDHNSSIGYDFLDCTGGEVHNNAGSNSAGAETAACRFRAVNANSGNMKFYGNQFGIYDTNTTGVVIDGTANLLDSVCFDSNHIGGHRFAGDFNGGMGIHFLNNHFEVDGTQNTYVIKIREHSCSLDFMGGFAGGTTTDQLDRIFDHSTSANVRTVNIDGIYVYGTKDNAAGGRLAYLPYGPATRVSRKNIMYYNGSTGIRSGNDRANILPEVFHGMTTPSTGYYDVGDIVRNNSLTLTSGNVYEWVCTTKGEGTAAAWKRNAMVP